MEKGNITKKKTRQQLADDLGINIKTMRNAVRYSENLEIIEKNIGTERAEKFNEIVDKLYKNKKEKISDNQIFWLSKMPPEEQIRIVDAIIRRPVFAKQIINNAIPFCGTKITVTLPNFISDWLSTVAFDAGLSKGKYLEKLLIEMYENRDTE